jgi:hypothetical protein
MSAGNLRPYFRKACGAFREAPVRKLWARRSGGVSFRLPESVGTLAPGARRPLGRSLAAPVGPARIGRPAGRWVAAGARQPRHVAGAAAATRPGPGDPVGQGVGSCGAGGAGAQLGCSGLEGWQACRWARRAAAAGLRRSGAAWRAPPGHGSKCGVNGGGRQSHCAFQWDKGRRPCGHREGRAGSPGAPAGGAPELGREAAARASGGGGAGLRAQRLAPISVRLEGPGLRAHRPGNPLVVGGHGAAPQAGTDKGRRQPALSAPGQSRPRAPRRRRRGSRGILGARAARRRAAQEPGAAPPRVGPGRAGERRARWAWFGSLATGGGPPGAGLRAVARKRPRRPLTRHKLAGRRGARLGAAFLRCREEAKARPETWCDGHRGRHLARESQSGTYLEAWLARGAVRQSVFQ